METKIPIVLGLVFAAVFMFPMVVLLGQTLSFQSFANALSTPDLLQIIATTIWPSMIGGGIAVVSAVLYAWAIHRTDVPGKKVLSLLPLLGLTQPSVIRAVGLTFLFSPRIGIINLLFDGAFNVKFPLFDIFTPWGLVMAHAIGSFPFSYLVVSASIRGMDSSLEESSRVSGGGILGTFRSVTIPLLRPALVTTFLITLPISMANFDYPFIFGSASSGGATNTLATAIYDQVSETIPPDYNTAAALSVFYLIITALAVTVYISATRQRFRYQVSTTGRNPQSVFALNKYRYPVLVLALALIIFEFFMPQFILTFVSLLPAFSFSSQTIALMSWNNYATLFFRAPLFWSALQNSLLLGVSVGVATAFLGSILAYTVAKSKTFGARFFDYFNTLPYAIPGVVYGLAILWAFLSVPILARYLYGTPYLLFIALVITWVPFSVRIIAPALLQVPNDAEDAARIAGAKWTRIYRTVLAPMLRIAIVTSFAYVFLDVFRELGIVILLATPNSYTLTSFIADLIVSSAGTYPEVAACATLMTIIAAAFLVFASEVLGVDLLQSRQHTTQ
jgi:iron(III) transport system permease protein